MRIGDTSIDRLFLLSGEDLCLTEKITVKHPKLNDILSLSPAHRCDSIYWEYVCNLVCDSYDHMVWLDDSGVDYETISPFQLFIMRWRDLNKQYIEKKEQFDQVGFNPLLPLSNALSFFWGCHNFAVGVLNNTDEPMDVIYDKNNPEYYITSQEFNLITDFIKLINGVDNAGDRIHPKDSVGKKILIEDQRAELKRASQKRTDGTNDFIGDFVAGTLFGGNGGITPFNYRQLPVYMVIDGLRTTKRKINYSHLTLMACAGALENTNILAEEAVWEKHPPYLNTGGHK